MRAQTLPAAAGWRWLVDGFAIYRRNPPVMSALVISYWLIVLFLNLLPVVGALAASAIIPGLSVGLMQASRHLERGQPVNLTILFAAFRENARTLLLLGALYLLVTLGVLGLSALADGGALLQYMLAGNRTERAAVEDVDFTLSAALVAILMVPVLMAWWFAPVLAAWHRLTLGRSLFFSLVACTMNWRPFLVYSLGVLAIGVFVPGLLVGMLLVAVPGLQEFAAVIVTMAMALLIAPTVFASFYVGYRDIFGISELA
ncbi:BPSS1780 family membrane protein [Azonexus sp. R2A-61]|uniref:BPSS1780 family membrane protein n=1 Tax=Azonexus sp. R2A61 TaxID=2744443 RepID=UPI001F297FD7